MIEFNIGDKVFVKDYRIGQALIVDKLYSEARSKYLYYIHFDGDLQPSLTQFDADSLELIKDEPITYCHEFDYLDNVVVCRFFEVKGDTKTEIMRGHGHIIHEGAMGIAQASAYALKKIWQKMNGEIQ